MLQNVCEHIHNYFIKDVFEGKYEIADGMISLPLLNGQRFLITGSALNDGVYTYHDTWIGNDDDTEAAGLRDETWTGTICGMAVPPAVITLSGEIIAWVESNADTLKSPYTSESWGGYSYTKATSKNGGMAGWADIFADRLNRWRKISL